jgi:hypothetical protein
VVIGVTFVIAGVILQVLLSMLTAEGAYKLATLKREHQLLQTEVQIISQEVDSLASPQYLADSANRLGMVANPSPVFLDLEIGKVFGEPSKAAKGGEVAARNLVANSALGSLDSMESVEVASATVSDGDEAAGPEIEILDQIPASPTR